MGFITTVGLHVAFGVVALLSKNGKLMIGYLFGLPIVQILWVVPLFMFKYTKMQRRFSKGVLLCAAVTVLLYGACWGIASTRFH
jgi:uncharacterized membrane protein